MTEIMHLPIPSELPWRVDTDKTNGHGGFSVYCANGTLIANLYAMDSIKAGFGKEEDARSRCAEGQPKTAANARLIVLAVNHHEELVDQIQEAISFAENINTGHKYDPVSVRQHAASLRAVIAKLAKVTT